MKIYLSIYLCIYLSIYLHHVQAIQKQAPGQDEGGQDGDPQVGQCDCAGGQVFQHVQDECGRVQQKAKGQHNEGLQKGPQERRG